MRTQERSRATISRKLVFCVKEQHPSKSNCILETRYGHNHLGLDSNLVSCSVRRSGSNFRSSPISSYPSSSFGPINKNFYSSNFFQLCSNIRLFYDKRRAFLYLMWVRFVYRARTANRFSIMFYQSLQVSCSLGTSSASHTRRTLPTSINHTFQWKHEPFYQGI